tara:strand:+ start:3398 stop:3643 length:246 start_codon:yes stop_codon:yes gene_type:complete
MVKKLKLNLKKMKNTKVSKESIQDKVDRYSKMNLEQLNEVIKNLEAKISAFMMQQKEQEMRVQKLSSQRIGKLVTGEKYLK